MTEKRSGVSTVRIPSYSEVAQLLRIWGGVPKPVVAGMIKAIADQTGTIRKPVDWSDPDSWIGRRLSGEVGDLALRIWQESGNRINPRYVYDAYLFIINKGLLDSNIFGEYQLKTFRSHPGLAGLSAGIFHIHLPGKHQGIVTQPAA
jgi:hypothetical protein